jgi:hypothetical protein
MGFWDWLSGKPKIVEVSDDVIWMNQAAKFKGLRHAVEKRLQDSVVILVVAHFPKTLAQVAEALGELPWRYSRSGDTRLPVAEALRGAGKGTSPCLALAASLVAADPPEPLDEEAGLVSILAAERHFLRTHDDQIVDFAKCLGRRCHITFYLSLHDPLVRGMVGEWVEGILTRLGMTASEPIASRMVARQFKRAQRVFAGQAHPDRAAESAEEWLEGKGPGMKS